MLHTDPKKRNSSSVTGNKSSLKPPNSHQRVSRSVGNSPISSPTMSRKVISPKKQPVNEQLIETLADKSVLLEIDVSEVDELAIPSSCPETKTTLDPLLQCPCGKSDQKSTYVKCAKCEQEWHSRCCNLTGLTQGAVKKLTTWECPSCYSCPYIKNSAALSSKCDDGQSFSSFISSSARIEKCTEELNESISHVEFFNTHLRHLLLDGTKFEEHTLKTKDVVANLESIKDQLSEHRSGQQSILELKDAIEKQNHLLSNQISQLQHQLTTHLQNPSSIGSCECSEKLNLLSDQVSSLTSIQKSQKCSIPQDDFMAKMSCMQNDIAELSEKVSSMHSQMGTAVVDSSNHPESSTSETHQSIISGQDSAVRPNTVSPHYKTTKDVFCDPFESYIPDAISPDTKTELLKLVYEVENDFQQIGGQSRDVLYFGEYSYKYTGKEHNAKPMPSAVLKLLDEIKSKVPDDCTNFNSCLISRYMSGKNIIPPHRDDEPIINPDSLILTASLGAHRKMLFSSNDGSKVIEQELEDGSLLVSSRFCQDFWTHGIPEDDSEEARFSFTFRHIAPQFLNSTVVFGDSNTQYLRFGEGKGTLGSWLPGKRVKAGHIDEIPEPKDIGPYRNIILHTGINNISNSQNRKSDTYLIHTLEQKCKDIMSTYPKARIHVSLLLPTKSKNLNQRVKSFNDSILDMSYIHKNISIIDNALFGDCLTDEFGRWDSVAGKPNSQDILHLGKKGIRVLAKNIKSSVINRGKGQSRARFNASRGQFSDVVARAAGTRQSHGGNRFAPLANQHD